MTEYGKELSCSPTNVETVNQWIHQFSYRARKQPGRHIFQLQRGCWLVNRERNQYDSSNSQPLNRKVSPVATRVKGVVTREKRTYLAKSYLNCDTNITTGTGEEI